eukprot:scaffold36113_cov18-Tisochrysis_lutea.AAC.1
MEPVKRAKHEPSLLAVDELLGRPSQSAQAPMPVQQGVDYKTSTKADFVAISVPVSSCVRLRTSMPPTAPSTASNTAVISLGACVGIFLDYDPCPFLHASAAARVPGPGPSTYAGNTGALTTFQDIAFQGVNLGANSNPE